MQHGSPRSLSLTPMVRASLIALTICFVLLPSNLFGQQNYLGRYDIYGGWGYLNSPSINLAESGFHFQTGIRMNRWLSLGFDYTVATGDTALTPDLLISSLKQTLGAELAQMAGAGLIPANYALRVPLGSKTQTFAAGPQVSYRPKPKLTLFVRPDLGAMQETGTPHPADPIATAIVAQLAPSGKKQDWVAFYGFGGGFDFGVSKHLGIRVQADFVHDHLFNDLLNGRNTVRFSIGPCVQFGRNVE